MLIPSLSFSHYIWWWEEQRLDPPVPARLKPQRIWVKLSAWWFMFLIARNRWTIRWKFIANMLSNTLANIFMTMLANKLTNTRSVEIFVGRQSKLSNKLSTKIVRQFSVEMSKFRRSFDTSKIHWRDTVVSKKVSKSTKNCRRGIKNVEGSVDVDEKLSNRKSFDSFLSKFANFDAPSTCRRSVEMLSKATDRVWIHNILVALYKYIERYGA